MTADWKHSSYEALESWRQAQKLSLKALGKLLGVTDRTLLRWRSGESAPRLSVQTAIEQMITKGGRPGDGTSSIVTAYLATNKKQLTPKELVELVREVRDALHGNEEE
jgi:transcriptional regulator with XRE-family HTH domain